MVKNGQKWLKNGQNGQKMIKNDQKWSKNDQNIEFIIYKTN